MDDRLKESISALMDDEANELELQRVLVHAEKEELMGTWKSYQTIKSVLKHEHGDFLAIDISRSVSQAIEQEAPLALNDDLNSTVEAFSEQAGDLNSSSTGQTNASFITKISSGLAIAASILIAIVFVLQNGEYGAIGLSDNLVASESTSLTTGLNVSGLQTVSTLLTPSSTLNTSKKQPKIIVEFTEEHARRFNEYLLRHAENSVASSHSGMIPLARLASVNSVGI
jgi:sigma-E factor negative regulatory protein RseA